MPLPPCTLLHVSIYVCHTFSFSTMGFIRAFVCVSRAPAQAQGHDPPDSYNPTRQAVPSIRVSTAPPLLAYLPAHGAAFLASWRTSIASRRQTDSGLSIFQL